MKPLQLFISKNIATDNNFISGGILVNSKGKILKILNEEDTKLYETAENIKVYDAGDHVIMPGIIDSHVHVNEPGRTEWEGFESATKAAAAGGVTTIVDMPLNSIPPTTTLANFYEKLKTAKGKCYVDVAFWGGIIPGNQDELLKLVKAGVIGFKCFMCPSGVDEFPHVGVEDIDLAMKTLQDTDAVMAFHAEVDEDVPMEGDPTLYESFLKSRPPSMELNAIEQVINLVQKYKVRAHIVHLSAAGALPMIAAAKAKGLALSVETCHHYLNFTSEEIPSKATEYKCTPPIRNLKNEELLWEALLRGTIDMVVSDHSPCTANLKCLQSGDFFKAWGGIASMQFGLSLFWTQLKSRGLSTFEITKYMTHMPAKLAGLHTRKGKIADFYDADFVIWDPNTVIEIEESMIQHKNKITPYLGKKLYGKVVATVVRGEIVYENGKIAQTPTGELLTA